MIVANGEGFLLIPCQAFVIMTEKEKFVLENYQITKDGKVFSYFTNKYLKFREDKDGYYDVTLVYNNNGNRMPFRVHRLVALKYLPKIEGYDVVNHKDLNKKNNNIENLEWSTVQLNTQHSYDYGEYKTVQRVKVTESNGTIHIFPSVSHTARYYNYANPTTIQAVLEGRKNNPMVRGRCKDFFFEYTNEGVTTIERVADTVISE